MCGLRLTYEKKKMGHGYTRTAGPPAHHVAMAMEELRSTIPAEDLTESIVKGKIMEIQRRKKVMGEKVKIETQMEEREPSPRPPTCDDRRRTGRSLPTTATSSQDVVAMSRAKAAPRKREPRPTLGNPVAKTESEKEKDLEEAWLLFRIAGASRFHAPHNRLAGAAGKALALALAFAFGVASAASAASTS